MRMRRVAVAAGRLGLFVALELITLVLLALTAPLFFWRILTSNPNDAATFPLGDFTELHFPYRHWAAEEIARGRLPTWNPYLSAGHPSLGDVQFGLLYPINTFFARLYDGDLPVLGLEQQVVLHFSIAALGAYLFARALGCGRAGSALASLAFAYAGYMTSFPVQQIIILQTSVWLPWILLGIELSFRWRQPLFGFVTAAATTMAALVGHPQTLAYVLGLSAAYGLYRAFTRFSVRGFLGAAVGGLLGIGLAAPALMPALEHLRLTARTDVGYAFTAHGFTAHELLGLIFPTDLGGRPLFVGMLVIALAAVALGTRRPGSGFWAAAAGVSLVLSLGGNSFLYPAAYAVLPGMQFFRDHERAALLVSLCLAVLAGQGARVLLASGTDGARPAAARAVKLALAVGAVFGLFGLLLQYAVMTSEGDRRNQIGAIADRSLLTAMFAFLTVGLLLAARKPVRGPILALGLVGLCGVELFTASWQQNLAPGSPKTLLRPTAAVQFLKAQLGPLERIASEGHLPANGNAGALFRLPDVVGNSPLDLESYKVFGEKVEELTRWRLLGVRFVLTRRDINDPRLARVFQDSVFFVYDLDPRLRLPRAWLVHRALVAPTRDDELELTRRLKPDEEVVLPVSPGELDGRAPDRPVAEGTDVAISAYENERIALRTWSTRPAVVVLGERDYPGWSATLDGQPTQLLRSNYALRGVYVPAGRHEVELRFAPPGFAAGQRLADQALSVAVVLALLAALLPLLLWGAPRLVAILPQRRLVPARRRRYSPEDATPA